MDLSAVFLCHVGSDGNCSFMDAHAKISGPLEALYPGGNLEDFHLGGNGGVAARCVLRTPRCVPRQPQRGAFLSTGSKPYRNIAAQLSNHARTLTCGRRELTFGHHGPVLGAEVCVSRHQNRVAVTKSAATTYGKFAT